MKYTLQSSKVVWMMGLVFVASQQNFSFAMPPKPSKKRALSPSRSSSSQTVGAEIGIPDPASQSTAVTPVTPITPPTDALAQLTIAQQSITNLAGPSASSACTASSSAAAAPNSELPPLGFLDLFNFLLKREDEASLEAIFEFGKYIMERADPEVGLNLIKYAAEKRSRRAEFAMYFIFKNSRPKPCSEEEAMEYLRRSATRFSPAQHELAALGFQLRAYSIPRSGITRDSLLKDMDRISEYPATVEELRKGQESSEKVKALASRASHFYKHGNRSYRDLAILSNDLVVSIETIKTRDLFVHMGLIPSNPSTDEEFALFAWLYMKLPTTQAWEDKRALMHDRALELFSQLNPSLTDRTPLEAAFYAKLRTFMNLVSLPSQYDQITETSDSIKPSAGKGSGAGGAGGAGVGGSSL